MPKPKDSTHHDHALSKQQEFSRVMASETSHIPKSSVYSNRIGQSSQYSSSYYTREE